LLASSNLEPSESTVVISTYLPNLKRERVEKYFTAYSGEADAFKPVYIYFPHVSTMLLVCICITLKFCEKAAIIKKEYRITGQEDTLSCILVMCDVHVVVTNDRHCIYMKRWFVCITNTTSIKHPQCLSW